MFRGAGRRQLCRLFGFRSVISSQIHRSLVAADNAFLHQSSHHSDGWGVAYYVAGAPHLIKSTSTAITDTLFTKLSGIVSSETVIAHLRKATQGQLCITNSHPFQYGKWVFAHNGNIAGFADHRETLLKHVNPVLRRFILGTTDSELMFYLMLSQIMRRAPLHRPGIPVEDISEAALDTVKLIVDIAGPMHNVDKGPPNLTYLTFLLTDGQTMVAHQGGKMLYYSTYKTLCNDRDSCPHHAPECEGPTRSGYVNHLIFSSEPVGTENIWTPMKMGQIVAVDWNMKLGFFGAGAPEMTAAMLARQVDGESEAAEARVRLAHSDLAPNVNLTCA